MRVVSFLIATCLLLSMAASAQADTIQVGPGHEFSMIQDAIDAADPGSTIEVIGGVYCENLNVTKELSLKGIGMPVIDACGGRYSAMLSADGIAIEGFNMSNSSKDGISVLSDRCVVSGNTVSGNAVSGIALYSAMNNTISNNTVSGNRYFGIDLEDSADNFIEGNIAFGNGHAGINLADSFRNRLVGNRAIQNGNDGIELTDSYSNYIVDCLVIDNKDGICLEDGSENNTVIHNNASSNEMDGFLLRRSNRNLIYGNYATRNHGAIFLEYSSENRITGNTALDNLEGIHIEYLSSLNQIFWNLLDRSSNFNAYDGSGDNQWDNGTLGNYYGDLEGCAASGGICSSDYSIPGGSSKDRHPLADAPDYD